MPKRPARILLALLLVSSALSAQGGDTAVLFLGNSYTGANNLPVMFRLLAASGGHTVREEKHVPGGSTLGSSLFSTPHMSSPISLGLIAQGGWDFVVLQEQSVTPMIGYTKNNFMIPGVAGLDASIKASNPGAVTLLYQTWARRDPGVYCWGSWCSTNFPNVEAMQDKISLSYSQAAGPVGASTAPVGEAWRTFRQEHPSTGLHSGDGSHPNTLGTYLAACTFYAAIFDESPVGLPFSSGLGVHETQLAQETATRTVFECGFSSYGQGLGGTNTMELAGVGLPSVGGSAEIAVANLPAGGNGATLIPSLGEASLPAFGGTLLVDMASSLPMLFLPDGPNGPSLPFTLPNDASLSGLTAFLQTGAADAGSPSGWALSNGLRLTICP